VQYLVVTTKIKAIFEIPAHHDDEIRVFFNDLLRPK